MATDAIGLPAAIEPCEDTTASATFEAVGAESGGATFSTLTTRGGVYLGLRYGLGVLISIGNMFVLTWWIGPHAYGIFVTAIGLTAFLGSLTRSGIDTYLVRRAAAPHEDMYHIASTLIGGFSVVFMAVGVALVPLLTRWYGNREFVSPYSVLLLTVPIVGLAGPPTAKLERAMDFRSVAQIELGSQMLALVVSLTLAWRGLGVWAPVLGHLTWQGSVLVAAFWKARFVPRVRFEAWCAREMLSFGAGYTASLRTWQLRTLVNPLLVGRFAGSEGVAFVGLAIRIAEGLGFIRIAAARLAIASLARLQDNREKFRAAVEKALEIQACAGSLAVRIRPGGTLRGASADGCALDAQLAGLSVHRHRSAGEFSFQFAGIGVVCTWRTMGRSESVRQSCSVACVWDVFPVPAFWAFRLWVGRTVGMPGVRVPSPGPGAPRGYFTTKTVATGSSIHVVVIHSQCRSCMVTGLQFPIAPSHGYQGSELDIGMPDPIRNERLCSGQEN